LNIHAVSNVCRHQGGPLGEGRIVDGCVTCPWHGFQYRASDGCAPPPYSEKIATYATRIVAGEVFVDPAPAAPGTPIAPSTIAPSAMTAERPGTS
jgi:nitrite reductase/ring-hydroxylating ferredoxin subunit